MTLADALREGHKRDIVDWHLRVKSVNGRVQFYIHAAGQGSVTLDFAVDTTVTGLEFLDPSMYNDLAKWPTE